MNSPNKNIKPKLVGGLGEKNLMEGLNGTNMIGYTIVELLVCVYRLVYPEVVIGT